MCLHTLRLLQSVLAVEEDEEVAAEGRRSLGASLLDPELRARVSQLTRRGQSSLRLAAHQTLEDLQQVPAPQLFFGREAFGYINMKTKEVLTDASSMSLISDCFQVSGCKENH